MGEILTKHNVCFLALLNHQRAVVQVPNDCLKLRPLLEYDLLLLIVADQDSDVPFRVLLEKSSDEGAADVAGDAGHEDSWRGRHFGLKR